MIYNWYEFFFKDHIFQGFFKVNCVFFLLHRVADKKNINFNILYNILFE